MCPSTGPRVDPHSVSVCSAGGLWHGLSGAEEVHPQGLSSQVGDRELIQLVLICFSSFKQVKTYFLLGCFLHILCEISFSFRIFLLACKIIYIASPPPKSLQVITGRLGPKARWVTRWLAVLGGLSSWLHSNKSLLLNCWHVVDGWGNLNDWWKWVTFPVKAVIK